MRVVTVETLLRTLGGKKNGNGVLSRTPGHSARDRGMRVWPDPTDPKGFKVHLFNGDDWRVAKDHIARALGRPEWRPGGLRQPTPSPRESRSESDKSRIAVRLFDQAVPVAGTLGAVYLSSRAIHDVHSEAVRFSPMSPVRLPDGPKQYLPTLICLMRDVLTDEPRAVHRTYLKPDGSGKAELEGGARRMLGPAAGCAIKLSPDHTVELGLGIAEGLETALSLLQTGWGPIWALGSAGAIKRFPVLGGIEALTIFADADEAGLRAAKICQSCWVEAGRECRILLPPQGGTDWNDVVGAAA